MSLVLAIEPDQRQASILKRIVREYVRADFVIVDSRDGAVSSISTRIPDVILVTALLSPRDEEELIAYLRGLEGAEHLETYTIPQLASTDDDGDQRGGGLFGKFRKKKDIDTIPGCDPEHFAEEIRAYLERANERKSEAAAGRQQRAALLEFKARKQEAGAASAGAAAAAEPEPQAPHSAWADPFAWRPASERAAPKPAAAAQTAPKL